MKRRDQLKAMMQPIVAAPETQERPRAPAPSGSLKAMGLTLKSLSEDAEAARGLRAQLAAGAQVVELLAEAIDPAFIRDRLGAPEGEEFEAFKAGLAEVGQQVPVLVRPSPREPGRYQAAYGHRRIAALSALGRPVKAIVRELSDEELVVAQGKENSDRRDLSFIERALFAARLEDGGFSRSALMSALSVQKGNLSTMISIVRELPEQLILAIGPAPKIGRPRWEQLAALVPPSGAKWSEVVADPGFAAAASDARFERVLKALSRRPKRASAQMIKAGDGRPLARVERAGRLTRLIVDERQSPEFAAYLVNQLPEIHAAFLRRTEA